MHIRTDTRKGRDLEGNSDDKDKPEDNEEGLGIIVHAGHERGSTAGRGQVTGLHVDSSAN